MTRAYLRKVFVIILALYVVLTTSFYFLAGDQLFYKESVNNIEMPEADNITDEIISGNVITQTFKCDIESITQFSIVFTKFYREGKGNLVIELLDGSKILANTSLDVADIPEQHRVYIEPTNPIEDVAGKDITIKIYSNAKSNTGVAAMIRQEGEPDDLMIQMGEKNINGRLCFSMEGIDVIETSQYYWFIIGGVGIILILFLLYSYKQFVDNKPTYIVIVIMAIKKYKFLIGQLVSRDFKSKYKRSVLGVLWSFLNPLLTMIVQFFVFSTIFKADTRSYPVYLLSGVICFNFFKECTDMCLTSLSSNANLINKVYVPKYIFPVAKTISSLINLGIALIPLALVCLILGIGFYKSTILSLYFIVCLLIFSFGIGLFLSAIMVFFRDVQFLWSVLTQIWMYATPIFYSAEIIPNKYIFILKINPLYHFIGNIRKCLMDGISPEPFAYITCLLFALISLGIGSYVFKKTQDKFTLYL